MPIRRMLKLRRRKVINEAYIVEVVSVGWKKKNNLRDSKERKPPGAQRLKEGRKQWVEVEGGELSNFKNGTRGYHYRRGCMGGALLNESLLKCKSHPVMLVLQALSCLLISE